MTWQDKLISITAASFAVMLIPALIDAAEGHGLNILTSLLTAIGCIIISTVFATMRMWLSAASQLACGLMWFAIFILTIISAGASA